MKLFNRNCSDCEHAKFSGKYLPATRYDTEEFPEMDECVAKDEDDQDLNIECNEDLAQICVYYKEKKFDENKKYRSRRSKG